MFFLLTISEKVIKKDLAETKMWLVKEIIKNNIVITGVNTDITNWNDTKNGMENFLDQILQIKLRSKKLRLAWERVNWSWEVLREQIVENKQELRNHVENVLSTLK